MSINTIVVGLEHFIDKIGYQAIEYAKNSISVKYLVQDFTGLSKEKARRYNADVSILHKFLFIRILQLIYFFVKLKPFFCEIYASKRSTIFNTFIAKIFRCKIIFFLRGTEFEYVGFSKWSIVSSLKLSDYIVVKEYHLLEKIKKLNINEKKIIFLHNAVPVPTEDKIISVNNRKIDIVYLNRILARRNVDVLIEAIKIISNKFKELNVVIAGFTILNNFKKKLGEVNTEKKILEKINEFKLKDCIQIKEFVNNPEEYYMNAKIFILQADVVFANFSLLEAMSYGVVPIIWGEGADKIVKHLENGLIVPPEPEKLANALKGVLKNEVLLNKLSYNARKTIIEKFNIGDWVDKLIKIREIKR